MKGIPMLMKSTQISWTVLQKLKVTEIVEATQRKIKWKARESKIPQCFLEWEETCCICGPGPIAAKQYSND